MTVRAMGVRQVLQFRLVLEGVEPAVWRRIQVPIDFTLARLHRVVQAVMGWQDYHLHQFTICGRAYGVPDPEDEHNVIEEGAVRLCDLQLSPGDRLEYLYDFGDDWQHVCELEKVLQGDANDLSPRCLGGDCSTPPEDVGGAPGYEEFLQALADPSHEEHAHMKSWVGRPFDPRSFSVEEANQRLRKIFRGRKAIQRS
ncbi:MAG: plasmid pRiA4b ORF-3 family protein [Candidatus Binataceae bacterium]|jgi:hypothetical protein|nr:plasmid pRiA4b ORF-3 family protein [Candidatus Binataceae bacterium]